VDAPTMTTPVYIGESYRKGNGHNGHNGAGTLPTSIDVIAGQSIAKKKSWSKRERAFHAAQWRLGHAQVAPTTKLAAEVFGVSVPLVNDVLGILQGHAPKSLKPKSKTPKKMSPAEIDAFVLANQDAVWASFVRITA
jgi:hypothetical protein